MLDLNYAGTEIIAKLTLGGQPLALGVYDATTHPAFLTGTGSLTVSVAPPEVIDIEFNVSGDVILTLDGPATGLHALQSNDLISDSFLVVPSTEGSNTLTIGEADVDPDDDGRSYFAVGE